jgi:hypothetical protein
MPNMKSPHPFVFTLCKGTKSEEDKFHAREDIDEDISTYLFKKSVFLESGQFGAVTSFIIRLFTVATNHLALLGRVKNCLPRNGPWTFLSKRLPN